MKSVFMIHGSLFILTLLLPVASAQQETWQNQVDEIFAPWDSIRSPGCALAIIRNGEIVYAQGYGMANLEHGIPITPDTVFYIASVSKQFVAASVALLAEQGHISLDDDVRTWFPELPEYESPITVRHWVHHTSGMRDYFDLWELAGRRVQDTMPEDEIVQMIARQQGLNHAPGERYLYCNSGYLLMAVLVERVTGMTLREYADKFFFTPFGMDNTLFHDNRDEIVPGRAIGHYPTEDGFGMYIANFDLVGSGGLNTSVSDLFLWDQRFYPQQTFSLSPELLQTLHTTATLNDGTPIDYAFGLRISDYRGLKTVGHSGSSFGYKTVLLRFPEQRFTVVILSNLNSVIPINLAHQVADLLLAEEFPAPKPQETQPPETLSLSEAQLRQYEGFYQQNDGDTVAILSWVDGHFMLELPNRSHQLEAIHENEFIASGNPEVRVTMTENGFQLAEPGADLSFTRLEPVDLSTEEIDPYTGRFYSHELDVEYLVHESEGRLLVRPDTNSTLSFTLTPVGKGVFVSQKGAVQIRFINENAFHFRRGWVRGISFTR